MDSLIHLVHNLRPGELQTIHSYYKIEFSDQNSNKRLLLLKLLLSGKVKSNDDLARIIYNQKPNSTLSKLKERLKEDILNFILLFPPDNLKVSHALKHELGCWKLLLQGKILLARGLIKEGIFLIKKASFIAEKYELMDVSIATNDTIRSGMRDSIDSQQVRKLNEKISRAQEKYRDLLKAKELYQLLVNRQLTSPGDSTARQDTIQESLELLKTRSENSGSRRLKFWYFFAAMRYFRNTGDLERSVENGLRLLELIDKGPSLFTDQTLLAVRLELSHILCQAGRYSEAELHALTALRICQKDSYIEFQLLGALFTIYFRNKSFEKANQLAETIVGHPQMEKYKNLQVMWYYYKSGIDFSIGNYNASIKRLNMLVKLAKDQKPYMVGIKYLELLNIIELRDYDWFEYKLESFRKYISRIDEPWIRRYKTIYKVFKMLLTANFDFSSVRKHALGQAEGYGKGSIPEASIPQNLEMVNFQDWLLKKSSATDE